MTTAIATKTFFVSIFFPLQNEWRELDIFESGLEKMSLSSKMSGLFPTGTKSRLKILKAMKESLNGQVVEIRTARDLIRIHCY
jgi:hypothetical protein